MQHLTGAHCPRPAPRCSQDTAGPVMWCNAAALSPLWGVVEVLKDLANMAQCCKEFWCACATVSHCIAGTPADSVAAHQPRQQDSGHGSAQGGCAGPGARQPRHPVWRCRRCDHGPLQPHSAPAEAGLRCPARPQDWHASPHAARAAADYPADCVPTSVLLRRVQGGPDQGGL